VQADSGAGWVILAMTDSSSSLVRRANLIPKIFLPRLVIPPPQVLSGMVDFAIASAILLVPMIIFGYLPGVLSLVVVSICLARAVVTAPGVDYRLSALNLRYRPCCSCFPSGALHFRRTERFFVDAV
jgi:ABC-type polysaccharide/polyol phosphate export permease